MRRPKYIEFREAPLSSAASIIPQRDSTSNTKKYKHYIKELSNRMGDDYVCAEELDSNDQMSQGTLSSQHNQSKITYSRASENRGRGNHMGKFKDRIIEQHYRENTEQDSDVYSFGSSYSYFEEETYLPMKQVSSRRSSENNFLIPSNIILKPRANLYLLTLFTGIITISSLFIDNGKSTPQSPSKTASLFFAVIALLISTTVGFGFRYAPMRIYITHPNPFYRKCFGQILFDTKEKLACLVLLASNIIVCIIVTRPLANMAITPDYQISNSPLYYSTWMSLYTCVIVIADLFSTVESRRINGGTHSDDYGIVSSSAHNRVVKVTWFAVLFTSCWQSAMLFSARDFGLYGRYHTKIMVVEFLSIFCGLIGIGMLALNHTEVKAQDSANSFGSWASSWESPSPQTHFLLRVDFGLGMVVLVLNCASVGIISFPPSSPGSIVFPCWVAFITSILLTKRCIEALLVINVETQSLPLSYSESCNAMSSDSERSKGTHTTARESESNSIECGVSEVVVSVSNTDHVCAHEELSSDHLKPPVNAREPEDDSRPRNEAKTSPSNTFKREPEEDGVLPSNEHQGTNLKSYTERERQDRVKYSSSSVVNKRLKHDTTADSTVQSPTSQMSTGDRYSEQTSRYPPPPPPPLPFKKVISKTKSERKRTHESRKARRKSRTACPRSDGFVRLSSKTPETIDVLVADALKHARRARNTTEDESSDSDESFVRRIARQICRRRSSGVISDSDESNEKRRARNIEFEHIMGTKNSDHPRDLPAEIFFTVSSENQAKVTPNSSRRTTSKSASSSSKSSSSRSNPYNFD